MREAEGQGSSSQPGFRTFLVVPNCGTMNVEMWKCGNVIGLTLLIYQIINHEESTILSPICGRLNFRSGGRVWDRDISSYSRRAG